MLGAPLLKIALRLPLPFVLLALAPFLATRLPRTVQAFQLRVGERTLELLLQCGERRRACRAPSTTRDDEAQRTVELRQFFFGEIARDLLREAEASDAR